jgi:hypothetical protein
MVPKLTMAVVCLVNVVACVTVKQTSSIINPAQTLKPAYDAPDNHNFLMT